MPACELNGIKLHWMERGAGPPMLLLSGTLSLGPEDFAPQIEHFSQTFRVILPDRRGYGRSRPPDRDYPPDFYQRDADDIAALLQELHAEETVVLGWSEGANVSVCLARTYPKLLRRLVIWGGIAAVRDSDLSIFEGRRDVAAWPKKVHEKMDAAHGESYWKLVWWKWCDIMRQLHAQGGDAQLGRIEEVSCPTLILHGRKDPLISGFHPDCLHARIKNSRLYEFETGGHGLHLQYASEFNRVVGDFVRLSG